jgi:hypothetical protein
MTRNQRDEIESLLTDLGGILHALDIIRMEGSLNKPAVECYALAVLTNLAVEKFKALQREYEAMPPKGATSCDCRQEAAS